MDTNLDAEIGLWQEKLFGVSLRRKRKLLNIRNLIGNAGNLNCLEVSAGDGMISAHIRSLGGSWKTVTPSEAAAVSIRQTLNEKVTCLNGGALPYDEGSFDVVVIIDALKSFSADYDFIRECHRVLKSNGCVIISEECARPIDLVALLRRLFGVSAIARGDKRNGYSNRDLYNILKDGFDVPDTNLYSNGFLESAFALGDAIQKRIIAQPYWLIEAKTGEETLYRYRRLHMLARIAYPLYWLLAFLDFLPGHKLLIKSRRRPWRPRLQPKLIDGRSIAEAAINTKIGTAAPF